MAITFDLRSQEPIREMLNIMIKRNNDFPNYYTKGFKTLGCQNDVIGPARKKR